MNSNLKQLIKVGFLILTIFTFSQSNGFGQPEFLKRAKNKVKKVTKIGGKAEHVEDMGITNDVHKNNIGKIVWSNEEIDMTTPDSSKFKNHFTTQEWIYGRFYLSQSIQNSIIDELGTQYMSAFFSYGDLYVDGKKIDWRLDQKNIWSKGEMESTTMNVLVYVKGNAKNENWVKLINGLGPGEHEIKVDLRAKSEYDEYKGIYATGSFKITKKEGDIVKVGRSYSDINAGMVDKEIENNILLCIQNKAKEDSWEETYNNVKIKSKDWDIIRNDYGVVLGRRITAYCFASKPDGHCAVRPYYFQQKYDGNSYGRYLYDGVAGYADFEEIDCK